MRQLLSVAVIVTLASVAVATQSTKKTEEQFLAIMLQHHRDGIEMARVAEEKATTAPVKALARRIRQSQERTLQQLQPFVPSSPTPIGTSGRQAETEHGLDHYTNTDELKKGLERMRSATGKQVDVAFLNEMSRHHAMSLTITRDTWFKTPRLKQLAEGMSLEQRKQIPELNRTLQQLP